MTRPAAPIAKNVYGEPLVACSFKPMTGYFRDGCCKTDASDTGNHVVCVVITDTFLRFSLLRGNDLSTPRPEWQFPGLKPGDQWCLCANRWVEAWEAGVAPPVVMESTHAKILELVDFDLLKEFEFTHQDSD